MNLEEKIQQAVYEYRVFNWLVLSGQIQYMCKQRTEKGYVRYWKFKGEELWISQREMAKEYLRRYRK